MFHHFHGAETPAYAQGSIDAARLETLIRALGPENILPPETWVERAERGTLSSSHCCLTFDDDLKSQITVAAPVLDRFGLKAFFFIYTGAYEMPPPPFELRRYFTNVNYPDVDSFYADFFEEARRQFPALDLKALFDEMLEQQFLAAYPFYTQKDRLYRYLRDVALGEEKYTAVMDRLMDNAGFDAEAACELLWLTPDDLRHLDRDGHTIGLHSHSHPTNMARLDYPTQHAEYAKSQSLLEGMLGRPVTAASYPSGSYNADSLRIMGELGIRAAFRSNPRDPAHAPATPMLEMGRLDHTLVDA